MQPTTVALSVLPPKTRPQPEPVSSALKRTLPHPDPKATVYTMKYSDDGKRLFTTGYPSGIIQFWDLDSGKEILRIDTPAGHRGSSEYAFLNADWSMLYVATEDSNTVPLERDGKKLRRLEYTGRIRRWDLRTKQELAPWAPPEGRGNVFARLTVDGRYILSLERFSRLSTEPARSATVLWDTTTGERIELGEEEVNALISGDGRRMILMQEVPAKGTTLVRLVSFPEMQELHRWEHRSNDGRFTRVLSYSPASQLLVLQLVGRKNTVPTLIFLDTDKLTEIGRWTGPPHPESYRWLSGRFTPDGKMFLFFNGSDALLFWDVSQRGVVRTVPWPHPTSWRSEITPDGRWFAAPWMPPADPEISSNPNADPKDLPQPRVTLIDLKNPKVEPMTFIAPHGYVGGVAIRPDGKQLAFGSAGGVHLFDLTKLDQ